MNVFLEDTWEATDIKNYFKKFQETQEIQETQETQETQEIRKTYNLKELTTDELRNLDSLEFISGIYFCNTDIVQYHLKKLNKEIVVPQTYEEIYNEYFRREIKIQMFKDIKSQMPIFLKPITNDKTFDGQIIYHIDTFLGKLPNDDDLVYTSPIHNIVSEYRLLIGRGKLYGKGKICGIQMDDILPIKMINELCDLTAEYRCIDIGYSQTIKNWMVIEINPPFSLDDHEIPFNDYMNFCIDSCIHNS